MTADNKTLQQKIVFWDENGLKDDNECSAKLRAHLRGASIDELSAYVEECLTGFSLLKNNPGLALQDIVNELGIRLEFEVAHGRYRGTKSRGDVGYDGLWQLLDGRQIIVEVKTTGVYSMSLDKLAEYRLQVDNKDETSFLVVVGRDDTEALEAQIRGSRHSWNVRLISVGKILDMVCLKNRSEQTLPQMQDILTPKEFTKLDDIIDLVFSTVEDSDESEFLSVVETGGETVASAGSVDGGKTEKFKLRESVQSNYAFCLQKVSIFLQANGMSGKIKGKGNLYESSDGAHVVLLLSKKYEKMGNKYWVTFRNVQKNFLQNAEKSHLIVGGKSGENLFAIPAKEFFTWENKMHRSMSHHFGLHVKIAERNGEFYIRTKKDCAEIKITQFLLK